KTQTSKFKKFRRSEVGDQLLVKAPTIEHILNSPLHASNVCVTRIMRASTNHQWGMRKIPLMEVSLYIGQFSTNTLKSFSFKK
ncbi:hypothetical protein, partial [Metabacillus fastidiosus]|uniref:hypothetical protein n=1 Tax=Metabacillus fastidiosus TaxID=1458 RepID=UPI002DB6B4D5